MTVSSDSARALLQQLARVRLPGSPGVAEVESLLQDRLAGLGYHVERQEFATTSRRLLAVAIGAAGYGWSALLAVPLLVLNVPAWSASLVLVSLFTLVGLIAHGLAEGRLPFDLPEVTASNLIATRGPVRAWLVAHSDSKAQGISMAMRVVAAMTGGVGLSGMFTLSLVRIATPIPWPVAVGCAALAAGGMALLSIRPLVANAPGAVDNATGLVAVLSAVEALGERYDIGVLITGAEEFGMEGARRWVATHPGGEFFVNFDGLDDRGAYNVMRHPAGSAERLEPVVETVIEQLRDRGATVRPKALPFGVFVDGGVLKGAGIPGMTISRGDWSTLRVVHTARDTVDRITGESARVSGLAVAQAVGLALG